MYKIAISGKANAGKDTVANLLVNAYSEFLPFTGAQKHSLADPIKEIVKIMFPKTKHRTLYGPSKNRMEIVPGAFKNGQQVTYRNILQEIGTEVGRSYNEDIWLDVLDYRAEKAKSRQLSLFIVPDCRFVNEFKYLKNKGYIMIRVKRNSQLNMSHASEVEQDQILDSEFDFVIDNNGSKEDLFEKIKQIVLML